MLAVGSNYHCGSGSMGGSYGYWSDSSGGGYYVDGEYFGSNYYYGSGSYDGSYGYWSDMGFGNYLGSEYPTFFLTGLVQWVAYMVTGPTRFRLALAVITVRMAVLTVIHRRIGGSGDSGMGYYEYEVGSGQYLEAKVRLLLIMVEARQMEAVTTRKVVTNMAQGCT